MTRKHTRAVIDNKLYSFVNYRNNHRSLICEDFEHPTVTAQFDEERMGYYTSAGHQVFLEGCSKFNEFVLWGIPIQD